MSTSHQPIIATTDGQIAGGSNDTVFVIRDNLNFDLIQNADSMLLIYGRYDRIGLSVFDKNETVIDHGTGTQITAYELGGPLTIYGLQNDPTGHVTFTDSLPFLTVPQALAAARPDGHGGTMIANVDFAGDRNLSAGNISIAHT